MYISTNFANHPVCIIAFDTTNFIQVVYIYIRIYTHICVFIYVNVSVFCQSPRMYCNMPDHQFHTGCAICSLHWNVLRERCIYTYVYIYMRIYKCMYTIMCVCIYIYI